MAVDESHHAELLRAVDLALGGDWDGAHAIAQRHDTDATACWIHAVLHKIDGDETNARYWYRRAKVDFERFPDPKVELRAILHELHHERRA